MGSQEKFTEIFQKNVTCCTFFGRFTLFSLKTSKSLGSTSSTMVHRRNFGKILNKTVATDTNFLNSAFSLRKCDDKKEQILFLNSFIYSFIYINVNDLLYCITEINHHRYGYYLTTLSSFVYDVILNCLKWVFLRFFFP